MEEKKTQLLEGVTNAHATPKAPQGKTSSSFAMYVDNKLNQMNGPSRTITEKRLMVISSKVEIETTCVTPTQRQQH